MKMHRKFLDQGIIIVIIIINFLLLNTVDKRNNYVYNVKSETR